MYSYQKTWNEQQQVLRRLLRSPDDFQPAIDLFLRQHAMVHSAEMVEARLWSFEDEVWNGLCPAVARRIPAGREHSIAWITWHITRIEDATMTMLVAGGGQLLHGGHWYERLKVAARDTGNLMSVVDIALLSAEIDLAVLRQYRIAVGRQTQAVVQRLSPPELAQKVTPTRLNQLIDQGVVIPEAVNVLAYWGGLTIAGLLLMPPTRHNFIHLNEAMRLKSKKQ
jgi:hypothetical protein